MLLQVLLPYFRSLNSVPQNVYSWLGKLFLQITPRLLILCLWVSAQKTLTPEVYLVTLSEVALATSLLSDPPTTTPTLYLITICILFRTLITLVDCPYFLIDGLCHFAEWKRSLRAVT